MLNKDKLKILKQILETAQKNIESAARLILELSGEKTDQAKADSDKISLLGAGAGQEEIIEGVFDGQTMVSASGKRFPVPENYASKSKLIEGDILKLTITPLGQYVYKQISPKERINLRGELLQDPDSGQYKVRAGSKEYQVLTASITYYHGRPGDQVIIIVPKDLDSKWAAVADVKPQEIKPAKSNEEFADFLEEI